MTERANKNDARVLACMHKESINQGFLSRLDISFLTSLYLYLIKKELVIVSREENKVNGFVSYSFSSSGIIKRFIYSKPLALFYLFFSIIKSPSLIKLVFETMKAPRKSGDQSDSLELVPPGELLSISVDSQLQKKGTGTILLNALENQLKTLQVDSYKVIAGDKLTGANNFYQKNGFRLAKTLTIHGDSVSNLYIKTI